MSEKLEYLPSNNINSRYNTCKLFALEKRAHVTAIFAITAFKHHNRTTNAL